MTAATSAGRSWRPYYLRRDDVRVVLAVNQLPVRDATRPTNLSEVPQTVPSNVSRAACVLADLGSAVRVKDQDVADALSAAQRALSGLRPSVRDASASRAACRDESVRRRTLGQHVLTQLNDAEAPHARTRRRARARIRDRA